MRCFGERGGDPDRPGKRDPLDACCGGPQRPGEPAWDSPFGPGRPGWHIECAAIALDHLGPRIDVQGGGSDLVFPHHEMGAAEAQSVTGERPFAHAYVHAGMVALDGEKMSKSKGNLVFVSKLRSRRASTRRDPAGVCPGPLSPGPAARRPTVLADAQWPAGFVARGRWSLPAGPSADDTSPGCASTCRRPGHAESPGRRGRLGTPRPHLRLSTPTSPRRPPRGAVDALLGIALR